MCMEGSVQDAPEFLWGLCPIKISPIKISPIKSPVEIDKPGAYTLDEVDLQSFLS